MARWVLHEEQIDRIDTVEVRRKLADKVAVDAKAIVARDTERSAEHIHVEVDGDTVLVVADAARTQKKGEEHYDYWVEVGARGIPAKPFLRPALYKYRSP